MKGRGADFHFRFRLRQLEGDGFESQAFDPDASAHGGKGHALSESSTCHVRQDSEGLLFPWRNPRTAPTGTMRNRPLMGRSREGSVWDWNQLRTTCSREALIALLQYPPDRLKGTWEGLAVGIAENKAVDALRVFAEEACGDRPSSPIAPWCRAMPVGKGQTVRPDHQSLRQYPSDRGDPEAEYLVARGRPRVARPRPKDSGRAATEDFLCDSLRRLHPERGRRRAWLDQPADRSNIQGFSLALEATLTIRSCVPEVVRLAERRTG